MAALLKGELKEKIITVFGGPHATFFPEMIGENCVDVICIGEGEEALAELADKIDKNEDYSEILNFWVKSGIGITRNGVRPLVENLDNLPFPDRDLYFKKYPDLNLSRQTFITGRGCPYECSYCFNRSFMNIYKERGRYIRWRSAGNIVKEMEECKNKYNFKTVYFQDDVFTLQPGLAGLLEIYKQKIGLRYVCLSRIELLDKKKLALLKESGCKRIFFGIEAGNPNIRKDILKRSLSNDTIIEKAMLIKNYGIKFRTYNMLGIPGESLENIYETFELNIKIKTDYPWCSILTPYPGTEMAKIFEKEYSVSLDVDTFDASFFKTSLRSDKNAAVISNLQKLFAWAVLFPVFFPAIKRLARLRIKPVYESIFLLFYAWSIWRSELLTIGDLYKLSKNNLRNFYWNPNQQ
jgi:radical SAM superfamily enzyme YgiQ (UPF0313 family)